MCSFLESERFLCYYFNFRWAVHGRVPCKSLSCLLKCCRALSSDSSVKVLAFGGTGEASPSSDPCQPWPWTLPWFPVYLVVYLCPLTALPCRSLVLQSSFLPGCLHMAPGHTCKAVGARVVFPAGH